MAFMNIIRNIALGLLLLNTCRAETVSILVNFGIEGSHVVTTAKAFQAADPKISKTSPVNQVSASKHMVWYMLGLLSAQNSQGGTHEIDLEGSFQNSNTAVAPIWTHKTPISDSYLFSKDKQPRTLTINGIKDAADTITLTVWGVGDKVGQHATITPTYAGVTLASKSTNFGTTTNKSTNAVPYVQFTFLADGETDSISFKWENPEDYSCFNGFSLSYGEKK